MVLVVVLLAGVYLIHARLLTTLVHDQRQQHLAARLNKPLPTIHAGDALGVIQIESQAVNSVFVEGVTVDHLRGAPAHLEGSALPGDAGVMVLYGHRTAYGGPFADVVDLVNGDSIVVQARNGGPIVRYIVERVERNTHVVDIELPTTDQISYLLIVTSEPGLFDGDQSVVVARALPVTDADATVPDLSVDVGVAAPFGIDALLAIVSMFGAVIAVHYLRPRTSSMVMIAAAAPMALFAVIRLLMLFDSALPITR